MKKLYFVGMGVILLMAVGLISYGTYLNKTDENQIEMRMENIGPLSTTSARLCSSTVRIPAPPRPS